MSEIIVSHLLEILSHRGDDLKILIYFGIEMENVLDDVRYRWYHDE